MKIPVQSSPLRFDLAVLVRFLMWRRKSILFHPTLDSLKRVSARQFWVLAEHSLEKNVEAPHAIHLPATEFLLPLLLPAQPGFPPGGNLTASGDQRA